MRKNILVSVVTILTILILVLSIPVLFSCRDDSKYINGEPLDKIVLGLSWIHQAQFSGEYYADQKGLYAQEGLIVSLVPAEIDKDPLKGLLTGEYDFAIAQPDRLIEARVSGVKLKAIAATYRMHPIVFCSLPDSGITKPQDFSGKTVGVAYSEELILKTMLRRLDINLDEVNIVDRDYNFQGLLTGELDIQGAWLTDEVQTARRSGLQFNLILPADYGITFYADIITTTEDMIENDFDLVLRFLRPTLEGWNRAIAEPEEYSQLTLLYDSNLIAQHEQDVLESSLPFIHTGVDHIGWMKQGDWDGMFKMLINEGIIIDGISPEDLYIIDFLEEIYGR